MDASERNRADLIEELVSLITGSLAFRSKQEIEGILEAMKIGESMAVNGLKSSNNSVIICINPAAEKEETVAALQELASRVDEQWEEFAYAAPIALTRQPRDTLLN